VLLALFGVIVLFFATACWTVIGIYWKCLIDAI